MAQSYAFPGTNKIFSDPHGEHADTFTFFNGMTAFSRWKLSPEELAEINRTGEVVVAQMLGKNVPMATTFVGSERNVRIATMDIIGRPLPKISAPCMQSDTHAG